MYVVEPLFSEWWGSERRSRSLGKDKMCLVFCPKFAQFVAQGYGITLQVGVSALVRKYTRPDHKECGRCLQYLIWTAIAIVTFVNEGTPFTLCGGTEGAQTPMNEIKHTASFLRKHYTCVGKR
jgi:hypothetical protein